MATKDHSRQHLYIYYQNVFIHLKLKALKLAPVVLLLLMLHSCSDEPKAPEVKVADANNILEINVQDIIAEGDLVATREAWKVTLASNNKALTGEIIHIFGFKGELITDEWSQGWEKWLLPEHSSGK